MLPTTPKPKTCHCGREFVPQRMGQRVCGPVCALRAVRSEAKAERARTRQRRDAIKTIPDLIKEAQAAFNAWVRVRDAGRECISCGVPLQHEAIGGGFDCGHYRSRGAASHLRFDERNAHGQCKRCNRYGAGMVVEYRIGLMDRIGQAALAALESDNRVHKWTAPELIAIRDTYRAKVKELKRGLA